MINTKFILSLLVVMGLTGCTGSEVTEQNRIEKVVKQKENKLSAMYLKQVSIISGRLDGMSQAIIQGLGETLDTARLAREMAENALALAEKNEKLLEELKAKPSAANTGGDDAEEEAQEDDF
jgi:hypothetical protein